MAYSPSNGLLIHYHCGCQYCSSRGGTTYFFYGSEAPTFTLSAISTKQKGKWLLTGLAETRELDACSIVPSISENSSNKDLAQELFNKSSDKWQRALKETRTKDIGEFWRRTKIERDAPPRIEQTPLSNGVVIGWGTNDENTLAMFEKTPTTLLSLSMGDTWFADYCSFCEQNVKYILDSDGRNNDLDKCGVDYVQDQINKHKALMASEDINTDDWKLYSDHCPKSDDTDDGTCRRHRDHSGIIDNMRPLEIIDGQHRVRGFNHHSNAIFENLDNYGICVWGNGMHDTPDSAEDTGKAACQKSKDVGGCGPDGWFKMNSPTRENIPFSMMVLEPNDSLDEKRKAEVFIDINTRAEDLAPNHKITMLWRHGVSDGRIDDTHKDWRRVEGTDLDFSSVTNTEYLVYSLILELAKESKYDQTVGQIPPISISSDKKNAENLIGVGHLRTLLIEWMNPGKVFAGYSDITSAPDYAIIFNRYLRAWAWHFSGPHHLGGEINDEPDKRVWTPSHQYYQAGNPWHDSEDLAGPAKNKLRDGGWIKKPGGTIEESYYSKGGVTQTGWLALAIHLFPIISLKIMQDIFLEADPNHAIEDWQNSHASAAPYNATNISERHYRAELKQFAEDIIFDDEDAGTKNSSVQGDAAKKAFANLLVEKYGWKHNG